MKTRWFWMLLACTAWAADITGKWTGSMELNTGNHGAVYIHLKQNGTVVTGTEGSSEGKQFPIVSGRIEGGQVTLDAKPGPAVLRLAMKLEGNRLTGDVIEDEVKIGTVSLQKAE